MSNAIAAVTAAILLWAQPATAAYPDRATEAADTVVSLDEVIVTSRYSYDAAMPSQVLSGGEIERLSQHSVADALRFFAGAQVKDYGGAGGLKTVNVRSMGSRHVAVFYDGMAMGNAQNGQTDLGQLSLNNVEEVALCNGQRGGTLLTAAELTAAAAVYIHTRRPLFGDGKKANVRASAGGGSSGTARLAAVWEQQLSPRLSLSTSVGGMTTNGKYSFRYRRKNTDGSTAYDTTATRHGGDVQALRAEANLYGTSRSTDWDAKLYTYHCERGIPGAIVNNVWRRGARQWDHNTMAQASARHAAGSTVAQLRAKYAYYNTRYVNNDTTTMLVDNTYKQQELTLSAAAERSGRTPAGTVWTVAAAYDIGWNKLNSDMTDFAFPRRTQHTAAASARVQTGQLTAEGSMALTAIHDRVKEGTAQPRRRRLTASAAASWRPGGGSFLLRAFAKQSYRMPTFNDLYYTEIGNASLVPETATQYDAGITYDRQTRDGLLRNISIQVDAYYNTVHDKIIAYPGGQLFRWTMLNLGRVHINGIDIAATAAVEPVSELLVLLRAQYTWQRAIDVTDSDDTFYGDQIPYVPRHSGSLTANAAWHGWDLNYSLVCTGERYSQKENTASNRMKPWYTSDISISKRLSGKHSDGRSNTPVASWLPAGTTWRVTLEIDNVLAQDYDIVLNYPMPGRSWALTVDVEM